MSWTLRYILEEIKPLQLSNTCLVAFKPIQDIMYVQLYETSIETEFVELCSNLTKEQKVLANKLWECVKFYQIVNSYSAFLYLEIINKNVDNITPDELIKKFNKNLSIYVNAAKTTSLQYIIEYVPKGPEYSSNKELQTRIILANIIEDLFLRSVVSNQDVGVSTYSIGGLTSSACDSVVDKFNRIITPHLNLKDITSYFCDEYKLNNYFFPSGLEYFTKNAPQVLGIPMPTIIPQYPLTDDIYLTEFCNTNVPQNSPAEADTGYIMGKYFGF
jgi:hypothetical protein